MIISLKVEVFLFSFIKKIFNLSLLSILLILLTNVGYVLSDDITEKLSTSIEKSTNAQALSNEAIKNSINAELLAQKALSNSELSLALSNERFSSIINLIYIISVALAIFLVITSLYEFNRRKIEQTRYGELIERQNKINDIEQNRYRELIKRQNELKNIEQDRYRELMNRQNKFDQAQLKLGDIQFRLGMKNLQNIDASFKSQVDSISKLGSVIELVRQSFESQSKASKKLTKLEEDIGSFKSVIEKQKQFHIKQFENLYNDLNPFTKLTRMEWPLISTEEQHHIERSLQRFESINEANLVDIDERERIPHACYLIGVGAFYRNDIITSLNYLKKSIKEYDELGGLDAVKNTEHHYPYAFAHHFLGILEKNWWDIKISIHANKQNSMEYIKRAKRLLEIKEGELLTPVTYAEVLTYIEAESENAKNQLDLCLKELKKINKLDSNQESLASRIYLYMGNLHYLKKNNDRAIKVYQLSIDSKEDNFYAWLSKGYLSYTLVKDSYKKDLQIGLDIIERTKALEKPEITNKITIHAWAAIASFILKTDNHKYYIGQFFNTIERARSVGNRKPLFFGPLSKGLVDREALNKEVKSIINKNENEC